jgi:Tol biopolymer transport system component
MCPASRLASLLALAALVLLSGCGGSDGDSVCGGDVGSTPVVCDLRVEPSEVAVGGSIALLEFGIADGEGDVVGACLLLEAATAGPYELCFGVNPPGGTLNDLVFVEGPIPLYEEGGKPLPPGDYALTLVVGDAAHNISNEASTPLRIVGTLPPPSPGVTPTPYPTPPPAPTPTPTPYPTPPPVPPTLGTTNIVFQAEARPNDLELYVMTLEGLAPTRISYAPGPDFAPAMSRDGETVVFISVRERYQDVYLMRPDGTGVRRVTRTPEPEIFPDISPDGTQVSYMRDVVAYVADVESGEERNVSVANVWSAAERPRFTPDGTRLVLRAAHDGRPGLFAVPIDGGDPVRLSPQGLLAYWIGFTPDGAGVYFVAATPDSSLWHLWRVGLDGREPTFLTTLPGQFRSAAVSPDGRRVAVWATAGQEQVEWRLYLKSLDGSDERDLAPGYPSAVGVPPVFSPDGTRVLFSSTFTGQSNLFVVDLDDFELTNVTPGARGATSADWR